MQWNRNGIDTYMAQVMEFCEKLLVLMHMGGGQPGRGPEILSCRHSNTARGEQRNIFVEQGLMVYVTRYHKGYVRKGDIMVIHRYLPRESRIGMGVSFGIQAYREIVIGISQKYMREGLSLQADTENEETADDGFNDIADVQAGHGSPVAGMIYA